MFGPFNRLDLFIYDRAAEPAAIWLNKALGLGNFTVSRWSFSASLAFGVMTLFVLGSTHYTAPPDTEFARPMTSSLLMVLIEFFYIVHGFRLAANAERDYKLSLNADRLPKNRRDGEHMEVRNRRFFLLLTLLFGPYRIWHYLAHQHPDSMSELFWLGSWLCALAGFYFLCTTPRPPAKREQTVLATPIPVRAG